MNVPDYYGVENYYIKLRRLAYDEPVLLPELAEQKSAEIIKKLFDFSLIKIETNDQAFFDEVFGTILS